MAWFVETNDTIGGDEKMLKKSQTNQKVSSIFYLGIAAGIS